MSYSTFSQIVFWFFVVVFSLVTILLVVKTVKGYQEANQNKTSISIKIITIFILWLIVSLYTFITNALAFWAASHSVETLLVKLDSSTISIIMTNLLWTLIGCGLSYWLSRQPKIKNIN